MLFRMAGCHILVEPWKNGLNAERVEGGMFAKKGVEGGVTFFFSLCLMGNFAVLRVI